jgi:ADP-ribose pyrophosphatase YjhB (NUDIX family)
MSVEQPIGPRPTVAAAAIAFDDGGRVLLIRRKNPPAAGLWTVPGGKVESGENLRDACLRELGEETGLAGNVITRVDVVERISTSYHYVIVDFLVEITGGDLRPGSDADDVAWVSENDLASIAVTEDLLVVIEKARALQ